MILKYIDSNTFQWEMVANVSTNKLNNLKSRKGAYLFRIAMDDTAPEDIYFDFRLPE